MGFRIFFVVLASVFLLTAAAFAQTSELTYQGKLTDGSVSGGLPTGTYHMQFSLWDAASGGTQIGSTISDTNVSVRSGIFTVPVDFGPGSFNGNPRWLEISVKKPADPTFTPLLPRQPLTSTPYTIRSLNTTFADSLTALCDPCVRDSQIIDILGTKVSGPVLSATNADNVTGIVPISNGGTGSPTKNFVDLSTNQNIAGRKAFVDPIQGDGSLLTNLPPPSDGSITTQKLADGSVTRAKLAVNFNNGFDPQLVAQLRWDQITVIPHLADVGRTPSALAFDGTFVWVANKLDNNVMRIRTSTGRLEGTPIPVGNAPSALVYDGVRSIWVANSSAGTVSRISIQNAAVDMTISVGGQPCALAFDGTLIYVGDCSSDKVTRITESGVISGQVTVGHKTVSLAFDGAYMYVAEPQNSGNGMPGKIRRILASTGAVDVITGPSLNVGALAFDGTFIYAASGSQVFRIRSSTGVLDTSNIFQIAGPLLLNNLAVVFNGTSLYGAGRNSGGPGTSNVVIKLNIQGLASESGSIPTQGTITALVFDGTYIYAASDRVDVGGGNVVLSGTVTRFQ